MKKRVAVGLSGGVDSSLTAYILKSDGFEVVGFTLKFFPEENRCCDTESLYQAQRLCHKLNIPHYVIDVRDLFKEKIINYFIKSYLRGLTPNPCAFCNRLIKFGNFLNKIKALRFDYLATGHYARIEKKGGQAYIKKSKDRKKSQEYFLSLIEPSVLKYLIFPLGDYTKDEVIRKARKEKIIFKERKESQDVCFVARGSYREFIEDNVLKTSRYGGKIKHINGKILGNHEGIYNFTCGQREGLGVAWKEPLYVTDMDAASATVFVGEKKHLVKDSFSIKDCNWFCSPQGIDNLKVKVRYNSAYYDCKLENKNGKTTVKLKKKIDGISAGQVASFYKDDLLIGGAIITK